MDMNEAERRGMVLFEHIADMLTVIRSWRALNVPNADATRMAKQAAERLVAMAAAVDQLMP